VDAAGSTVFTVARDGVIITYDMTLGDQQAASHPGRDGPTEWMHAACAVVARDLTPGEWAHYLPDQAYRPTCSDLF
jgi:hypothetical protein